VDPLNWPDPQSSLFLAGDAQAPAGRKSLFVEGKAEGVPAPAGVRERVDGRVAAGEVVAAFAVEGVGAEAPKRRSWPESCS
jgi:hypothetical protein